jgi:hypothetical protein
VVSNRNEERSRQWQAQAAIMDKSSSPGYWCSRPAVQRSEIAAVSIARDSLSEVFRKPNFEELV